MVKSFQGIKQEKVSKPELPSIVVRDYMSTKLITFSADQSIFEVIDKLLSHKISGGPVVNEQNELIGVISEGDCLKEVVKGKYHNMPILSGKVSEHMAKNVISISPEMSIFETADKFLNMKLRRFPVIENGKLIGQISQKDVMKAVKNLKSDTWHA